MLMKMYEDFGKKQRMRIRYQFLFFVTAWPSRISLLRELKNHFGNLLVFCFTFRSRDLS